MRPGPAAQCLAASARRVVGPFREARSVEGAASEVSDVARSDQIHQEVRERMNRRLSRIPFVVGAAAAAIAISATAAFAVSATWSITPAGTFTASLNSGTTTSLQDLTTKVTLSCAKSKSTGSVPKAGHGLSGSGIATITKTTWGTSTVKCTGPAGSSFIAVSKNTPWKLNAVSYKSSVDGGQTVGTITAAGTGVGGSITGTVLGTPCSATFGGTKTAPAKANALYDNGSHLLAITSVTNLKVTASTCPGVTKGDKASFITSPTSTAGTAVKHGYSVSTKIHLSSP